MKMNFKLAILALIVFGFACSPQKKEEKSKEEAFDKAEAEVNEQIKEVIAEMPAPSEIPFLLMETGAEFNPSLLHDIKMASKYTTKNEKALNLGAYATDVAYLSAYSKSQKALTYVAELKPIADQLALSNAFNPKMIERFEKNLSSTDSLAAIINEAVENADDHLKKTDRPKVSAMLLAGSFIEGLYIATALIENYPDDVLPDDAKTLILIPLVDVVLKQEEPVIDLIALLQSVPSDEKTQALIADLEQLKEEYKKLDVKKLMEEGRGDLLLKDEALDALTNTTGKIRDHITG